MSNDTFDQLKISTPLRNAIDELGFVTPTPIQKESYSVILSGQDMVGIAQTGTGKTFAYVIPILQQLSYSEQTNPKVLILVPTRELVLQVVQEINKLLTYITIRAIGVYGGANINNQRMACAQGADIVVGTPGRLYDLVISRSLSLKAVKQVVIDEVDVMLDLGFELQLERIFEHLPSQRQHVMFSATMTDEVDYLIEDYFKSPVKIAIKLSGTPLENISQESYFVSNFYTKINLLVHLLSDAEEFSKVLVFVSTKKRADVLFEQLDEELNGACALIHGNKTQNYRLRSIQQFEDGRSRILLATDVIARGLDLDKISHVINFDTPNFPENYMHRIGRTGRAEQKGKSILFFTEKEEFDKADIEELMNYEIPELDFPDEVKENSQLLDEERPNQRAKRNRIMHTEVLNAAFHEKSEKNQKTNQGGSYAKIIAAKYKKPKRRGDKIQNMNSKKKK
ncbi:MAG: DEAD/DEAH box helicase [Flavobacteriales bacterium]|nr:DEAD/DEAH box helicase [Flavobacteriales bacterium]